MSEKWFWAWRRMKYGVSETEGPRSDRDEALVAALVDAIVREDLPKGDGKFSRLVNYIASIREESEWIKRNFTGRDEILTAFVMGVDISFEILERVADKIKKGR